MIRQEVFPTHNISASSDRHLLHRQGVIEIQPDFMGKLLFPYLLDNQPVPL